jgi:hypothetical protein
MDCRGLRSKVNSQLMPCADDLAQHPAEAEWAADLRRTFRSRWSRRRRPLVPAPPATAHAVLALTEPHLLENGRNHLRVLNASDDLDCPVGAAPPRHDLRRESMNQRERAVVARQVHPGTRHQGGEPRQKIRRLRCALYSKWVFWIEPPDDIMSRGIINPPHQSKGHLSFRYCTFRNSLTQLLRQRGWGARAAPSPGVG